MKKLLKEKIEFLGLHRELENPELAAQISSLAKDEGKQKLADKAEQLADCWREILAEYDKKKPNFNTLYDLENKAEKLIVQIEEGGT